MPRLASTVNEPTLATTPSSTALRAQLAASRRRYWSSQKVDLERPALDAALIVDPLGVELAPRLGDVRVRRELTVDRRLRHDLDRLARWAAALPLVAGVVRCRRVGGAVVVVGAAVSAGASVAVSAPVPSGASVSPLASSSSPHAACKSAAAVSTQMMVRRRVRDGIIERSVERMAVPPGSANVRPEPPLVA